MSQLQVTGEAKIRDIQGPVVANSGVITALDGAASQYVRGDGTLADFPTSTGGGSSVSYYLNSSVSQGTIGGVAYRELSKEPIIGGGTDITISANGYVASYITDANDPDVLSVPGGNFNCEFYFSVNNNTGNPTTYAELYKYDGTTFTLLGSSQAVPESINQGTTIAPYYFAIPVATAALALTDRLAIRIYVSVDGRVVTLHTENSHLCQVVTTFSKGMVSLNNLTDQSQFITTGTSGTNFNIVSTGDTHTFNLPVASATNTGKLNSTDWSTFNNKIGGSGTTNTIPKFTASGTIGNSLLSDDGTDLEYQGSGFKGLEIKSTNNSTSLRLETSTSTNNEDTGIKEIEMLGHYSSFNSYFGYNSSGAEWRMFGYADTAANTTNRGVTQWWIPTKDGTYGSFEIVPYYNTSLKYFKIAANGAASFTGTLTGTSATFSGVLTLGSTISNGTNTYTLPSATGTIALTSNLSSYVPYTGATGNVDLGTRDLTSRFIYLNGIGTTGGNLFLRKDVDPAFTLNYTTLYSTDNNIGFGSTDGTNTKKAIFSFDLLTNNTLRTYTLPDLSGTLALLEGTQTFSGSKTFSANPSINAGGQSSLSILSSTGNSALILGYVNNILKGTIDISATEFKLISAIDNILKFQSSNNFRASLIFSNSADYSYTFPAASGTIALTSNIPSVSGTSTYIPVFTGSNSLGNSQIWNNGGIIGMGTNYSNPAFYVVASSGDTLTQGKLAINTTSFSGTSVLQVNGAATLTGNLTGTSAAFSSFVSAFSFTAIGGTSNAGQISLKHTGAISVGDGYVTIAADSSNTLGIYFFNSFSAKFSISALTNNRTYTLPDGTGTLALTSNLSAYLPLAGGTLTGALSGTSATFSFSNTGGSIDNNAYLRLVNTGTSTLNQSIDLVMRWQDGTYNGTGGISMVRESATARSGKLVLQPINSSGDNIAALTLASTGAATFSNSVLVTTNFEAGRTGGAVTAGDLSVDSTSTAAKVIIGRLSSTGSDNTTFVIRNRVGTEGVTMDGFGAASFLGTIRAKGGGAADINNVAIRVDNSKFQSFYNVAENGWAFSLGTNTSNDGLLLANNNMTFGTGSSATERMRITSGGDVLVGTTSNGNSSKLVLFGGASANTLECVHTGTADTFNLIFTNGNGLVGSIRTSGSTTTYYITSDYRLKQDLKDYSGLNLVSAIKTYDYEWKADNTRMYGVLAHELQEVIPYAVSGEKDAKEMQQVDYSKLVPIMVKAIQEQTQIITELEARIKQLENK